MDFPLAAIQTTSLVAIHEPGTDAFSRCKPPAPIRAIPARIVICP